MNIGTYCKHRVVTIAPHADLAEAAELMRTQHVGMLVVLRPGERRPVGVLTDRDIVVEVVAKDLPPRLITVGDAMTCDPVVVHDDDTLGRVTEEMRAKGVRRVPVVDRRGDLIGVIAADDLLDLSATMLFNLSAATHKEQCAERQHRS